MPEQFYAIRQIFRPVHNRLVPCRRLKKTQDTGWKFAIEIRNEKLLDGALTGMLRENNVALALTDTSFLPRPRFTKRTLDTR